MGTGAQTILIDEDTLIGNLWDYMGQPANPFDLIFTVNGADAADILIPLDFHGDCTFEFIAINGGRFVGSGGDAGDGADDNGGSGGQGGNGDGGTNAISVNTFDISIDVDDGYILGGGGGGGGGGYHDEGATGTPGGGGGGGQGYGIGYGGAAGIPTGFPVAEAGGDGNIDAAGVGGEGGTTATNDGGNGGTWGHGGELGLAPSLGLYGTQRGGCGGTAGSAVYPQNGSVVTWSGSLTEAQLRTALRIVGESGGIASIPNFLNIGNFTVGTPTSKSATFDFQNDSLGTLTTVTTDFGTNNRTDSWYRNNPPALTDYEVRDVLGIRTGTWSTIPGSHAEGDWETLDTVSLQWNLTSSAFAHVAQAFEIRRAGDTGGILTSGYLRAWNEYEP